MEGSAKTNNCGYGGAVLDQLNASSIDATPVHDYFSASPPKKIKPALFTISINSPPAKMGLAGPKK